jgi:hypothetical protein
MVAAFMQFLQHDGGIHAVSLGTLPMRVGLWWLKGFPVPGAMPHRAAAAEQALSSNNVNAASTPHSAAYLRHHHRPYPGKSGKSGDGMGRGCGRAGGCGPEGEGWREPVLAGLDAVV